MEPLSAVASAIAVVQVADRVISVCKAYITGVRDAPIELRAVLIEVGSLKCVLEVLELSVPSPQIPSQIGILEKLIGPINGCGQALREIEALFPQPDFPAKGKRERFALSLASLAWPFKRDKALKLLEEIGRHKATISLGLTTEAAHDLKYIRSNVDRIREMTDYNEFDRIIHWLVTTDPSPNHNMACQLHEPHTGQWLTRSPEYTGWKTLNTRFFWLHGIPGAGKTVLLSYIAEDIRNYCQTHLADAFGSAYYYCHFSRGQDETPHLLRWFISQLCRQINGTPPEVKQLFREGTQPSTSRLLDVLAIIIQSFSRVYLVVDALDESSERDNILKLLLRFTDDEKFQRVQLLTTSRKELEIERVLSNAATGMSLSNPYVDEDIKGFISSNLAGDYKFSRWPQSLRLEIESALSAGSNGMFRWVACQLDILRRLNNIDDIRGALRQLPETLDETYERILTAIPSESQAMARKTLHLLAGGRITTRAALVDALAVNEVDLSFNPERKPLDPDSPIEACTCLVTFNPKSDGIYLAHYTVEEYMLSPRITHGPARSFHTTDEAIRSLSARCLMVYMLQGDYLTPDISGGLIFDACPDWFTLIRELESEPEKELMMLLTFKLLDPKLPHFHPWLRANAEVSDVFDDGKFPVWTANQEDQVCLTLAYLCWFKLDEFLGIFLRQHEGSFPYDTQIWRPRDPLFSWSNLQYYSIEYCKSYYAEAINTPNRRMGRETMTLLHIAATSREKEYLEAFIFTGADINHISLSGLSVLTSALSVLPLDAQYVSKDGNLETVSPIVEFLIDEMDLRPQKCSISPIQMTLQALLCENSQSMDHAELCHQVIRRLLASGADANSVADDAANLIRIRNLSSLLLEQAMPSEPAQTKLEIQEFVLAQRGNPKTYGCYDTPLRIIRYLKEKLWASPSSSMPSSPFMHKIEEIEKLLETYGGRDLHLFPVKDLPGYNEAHMNEWHRICANESLSNHDIDTDLVLDYE